MIRILAFFSVLTLAGFAHADTTTLTTCSLTQQGGVTTSATIGVYSAEDHEGNLIRSLTASTLFLNEVPVPANQVNCDRTSCGHSSPDEVTPMSFRLYPHFRASSDVLSSITMETRSDIMIATDELTNCKVVDHFPEEGE